MEKPTQFTHSALIAAGYTRYSPDPIRGEGFVVYRDDSVRFWGQYSQVCFAGNNAVMTRRVEQIWKLGYPKLYKWWIDPKQRDPFDWEGTFIFIKGEDPMISEGHVIAAG